MLELMLRALVVGALVTVAAMLLERGLAHLHAGTRYAWTFALTATALAPFVPRLMPTSVEVMPVMQVPTIVMNKTSVGGSRVPLNLLLVLWLLLSVVALAAYAIAYVKLARSKRTWQPARIAQSDVFMSDGFGPAVFGFLAPRIVVPGWVRDAAGEEQELIVLHEREHIRAGDQLQLLLAIVATVVMPWNPFHMVAVATAALHDRGRLRSARARGSTGSGAIRVAVGARGEQAIGFVADAGVG